MQHLRKERVEDQIKKEVSFIIQRELKDPRAGFITITAAELSADLKSARIFYSVLGDDESKVKSEQALKSASGFIQRQIGIRMRLRYTPQLVFKYDYSIERGARIDEILRQIKQKEENGKKKN
jgi:ribosome-binding factor A